MVLDDNYTRNDLMKFDAAMNQMRNAVYHLARFMREKNVKNMEDRLRRMGKNIAQTISSYWKPADTVTMDNIRDVIATIFRNILNSSVTVAIDRTNRVITVTDRKCSMCKYYYDDIQIAGCEIVMGMVSEFINAINKMKILVLTPIKIKESRSYGDALCTMEIGYEVK